MLTALRLFHFDTNMCLSFHTSRYWVHNCVDTSSLKFPVCECKTSSTRRVVTFQGNRQTDGHKSYMVQENSLATTSPSDPSSTDEFSISVRLFAGNTFRLISFGDGGHRAVCPSTCLCLCSWLWITSHISDRREC